MAEQLEISMEATFRGPLARQIDREAKARGCEPAELVATIIENVFGDGIVAAVVDE